MHSDGLSQLLAPFGPVFRGANLDTSDVEDLRLQLDLLRSSHRPLLKIVNDDVEGTRMFTVEFKPHEATPSLSRKDVAGHMRLHCLEAECVSKVRGKPKLLFFTKDELNSPFLCLLSIRVSLGTAHEDAYHRLRVITGRADADDVGFEQVSEHKTTIVATALPFTAETLSHRLLAIGNLMNEPVKVIAEITSSSTSSTPLSRRTRRHRERRRYTEEDDGPFLSSFLKLLRIFKGRWLLVLLVLLAALHFRPTEKPQMRVMRRPLLEGPSNFSKLLSSPCGNDNLLRVYETVREELMTRAYKVWQLDRMIVPIKKGHAPWAVGKNRKDRPPEVYMDELADLTFEVLDILENGALLQIYSSPAADVNILLTFDRLLKSVRLLATALVLKERPKGEVNYIGNDIDRDWLIFAIACTQHLTFYADMLIYGSSADVTEAQVVHLQEFNAWMRERFRRANGLQTKGQWRQELRMKDQFEVHRAPKDMPPKAPISFTLGDMQVKIGPVDPTKPFNLPLP